MMALRLGVSVETVLRPFAAAYAEEGYTCEEYSSVLQSIQIIVETRSPPVSRLSQLTREERRVLRANLQPLLVYIDPMCSVCQDVTVRLLDYRQLCEPKPPVLFRLTAPEDEELASAACALLERERQRHPDLFLTTLHEFAASRPFDLPTLLAALPSGSGSHRATSEPHRRFDLPPPLSHLAAPIIVFRGRLLIKETRRRVPFRPTSTPILAFPIATLIEAYDARSSEDLTREKGTE